MECSFAQEDSSLMSILCPYVRGCLIIGLWLKEQDAYGNHALLFLEATEVIWDSENNRGWIIGSVIMESSNGMLITPVKRSGLRWWYPQYSTMQTGSYNYVILELPKFHMVDIIIWFCSQGWLGVKGELFRKHSILGMGSIYPE